LFDQRKAQARVLRDRLSTVQKADEPPAPDVALLRDEVLSRIPAFDTFLRRSDRVSQLQKVLAQGNVDVRAGNFLMLCAVSAWHSPPSRPSPAATCCSDGPAPCSAFLFPTPMPRICGPSALPNLKRNFPRPST